MESKIKKWKQPKSKQASGSLSSRTIWSTDLSSKRTIKRTSLILWLHQHLENNSQLIKNNLQSTKKQRTQILFQIKNPQISKPTKNGRKRRIIEEEKGETSKTVKTFIKTTDEVFPESSYNSTSSNQQAQSTITSDESIAESVNSKCRLLIIELVKFLTENPDCKEQLIQAIGSANSPNQHKQ